MRVFLFLDFLPVWEQNKSIVIHGPLLQSFLTYTEPIRQFA